MTYTDVRFPTSHGEIEHDFGLLLGEGDSLCEQETSVSFNGTSLMLAHNKEQAKKQRYGFFLRTILLWVL